MVAITVVKSASKLLSMEVRTIPTNLESEIRSSMISVVDIITKVEIIQEVVGITKATTTMVVIEVMEEL